MVIVLKCSGWYKGFLTIVHNCIEVICGDSGTVLARSACFSDPCCRAETCAEVAYAADLSTNVDMYY